MFYRDLRNISDTSDVPNYSHKSHSMAVHKAEVTKIFRDIYRFVPDQVYFHCFIISDESKEIK